MRIRRKVAAVAGAIALVSSVGISVATVSASATVTHIGDCTGGSRAIGKIGPTGLLKAKGVNTVSLKGIPSDVNEDGISDGATSFGSCTFVGGAGLGTHTITGFSAKVAGTLSCTPGAASDPTDQVATGKIAWKFSDATQTSAYLSITGFKTASTNVVNTTGLVTKGNGLGAIVNAQNAFLPVVKVTNKTTVAGAFNLWYDGSKTEYDLDVSSECAGGGAGVPLTQILVSTGGTSGATATSFDIGTVGLS